MLGHRPSYDRNSKPSRVRVRSLIGSVRLCMCLYLALATTNLALPASVDLTQAVARRTPRRRVDTVIERGRARRVPTKVGSTASAGGAGKALLSQARDGLWNHVALGSLAHLRLDDLALALPHEAVAIAGHAFARARASRARDHLQTPVGSPYPSLG